MSEAPLLEIKNLVTEFRTEDNVVRAVNDVSFVLNKGEVLGIVGESGSGKSVTSLSVMRLISSPPGKIAGGEIYFNNGSSTNLLKLEEKQMRHYRGKEIAMIFQEPMTSLNPVIKCGRQVTEAIRLHLKLSKKAAKEKTIQLFEEVQLPRPSNIFNSYPHELSGGQKQRVMIAMAMSCNPSILIADEPTTALDVTVQKTILELMKKLQAVHGMSIIFITHDLGVVAEIADKVLVMYKGKIVERGNVKDIFSNPQHPYTKGLLACRPTMDKRLKQLPVVSDFMLENKEGIIEERKYSLAEVNTNLSVSKEERNAELDKLYSKSPILEVKNLKTYFPVRKGRFGKAKDYIRAVDDVSFTVYPGETLGLVGESGCGKTTLGRTILRLIEPTAGHVMFNGVDIAMLSTNELRKVADDCRSFSRILILRLIPASALAAPLWNPCRCMAFMRMIKKEKLKCLNCSKG